jgi:protein-disulfide isomerase
MKLYKYFTYSMFFLSLSLVGCKDVKPADAKTIPSAQVIEEAKSKILQIKEDDVVLGNPEAKVKIFEYSSLTCHHCADFHTKVYKPFKENYIDKGKVTYIARLLPFDRQAFHATMLVRCAPREQYHTFINVLFDQQTNWVFSKDFKEILTQIGRLGGVGAEQYTKCLEDPELKDKVILQVKEASKIGINATPEIFINGKVFENTNKYEDFVKAVEQALNQTEAK